MNCNWDRDQAAPTPSPMRTSTPWLAPCPPPNRPPHTGPNMGSVSGGTATSTLNVRGGPFGPLTAAGAAAAVLAALLEAFCLLIGTAMATAIPNSSASRRQASSDHRMHFFLRAGAGSGPNRVVWCLGCLPDEEVGEESLSAGGVPLREVAAPAGLFALCLQAATPAGHTHRTAEQKDVQMYSSLLCFEFMFWNLFVCAQV